MSGTYKVIEVAKGFSCGPDADRPYGVYEYGEYPEGSVNEGQERRSYVGGPYATVEEARAEHPGAEYDGDDASGYVEHTVPLTPPPDFDPAAAGESWDGE